MIIKMTTPLTCVIIRYNVTYNYEIVIEHVKFIHFTLTLSMSPRDLSMLHIVPHKHYIYVP